MRVNALTRSTPVVTLLHSTSSMLRSQVSSASTEAIVPWNESVWMTRPENGTHGSPSVVATVSSQLSSSVYSTVAPTVKELVELIAMSVLPENVDVLVGVLSVGCKSDADR
ncbi:unannotated protein [freshwater metagenome]|uniref:Unannotated protein n=1 Tax=freshwater metagenome TaxID=449393 RepID=A0A6J6I6J5_9ZZZZ